MKQKLVVLLVLIYQVIGYGQVDSTAIKSVDAKLEEYYDYAYKNPDSALIILDIANEMAKKINYPQGQTTALRYRGSFYTERSDFVKSMEMLIAALKWDEDLKNGDGIAMDHLLIGLNYFYQEKMDLALISLKKAQKTYADLKDIAGVALINANLGMVYRNKDQFDTALIYYNSVRDYYYSQKNMDSQISHVENNIGNVYKDLKQYDKALEHYKISKAITLKLKDSYYMVNSLSNIADIYVEQKKYALAILNYDSAMVIAKEQRALSLQKDVCFDLANAYQKSGDYKMAFEFQKLYSKLKDSTISEKYETEMADMKVKYESDKKEAENKILRSDNELQEVKISEEQKQKVLFATIALIAFIAGATVFRQYRNKQKLNQELALINEKVNSQNSTLRILNRELIDSEESLTKANATKDQLISILSHDLYNPVTAVINYTNEIVDGSGKMDKKELRDSFMKVNAAVIPLQDLLENILQWARSHNSQLEPTIIDLNINIVIEKIIQLYQPAATFKSIKINRDFTETFVLKTDRLMIYFILRNVLNNAVKFCAANKQITISIKNFNHQCLISIRDEGKGFDEDVLEALNKNSQTEALISTHGSGIGLSVSRQFAKLLSGKIEFKNGFEGGGEVRLILPLT